MNVITDLEKSKYIGKLYKLKYGKTSHLRSPLTFPFRALNHSNDSIFLLLEDSIFMIMDIDFDHYERIMQKDFYIRFDGLLDSGIVFSAMYISPNELIECCGQQRYK